jgi:hypothetical protein
MTPTFESKDRVTGLEDIVFGVIFVSFMLHASRALNMLVALPSLATNQSRRAASRSRVWYEGPGQKSCTFSGYSH